MINLRPGDTYNGAFATCNAAGAAANADSLPTGSLYRNGSLDVGATVTVANAATGAYTVSVAISAGYSPGDRLQVLIAATVGGVTARAWLPAFTLVGWPATALPNAAAGANGGLLACAAANVLPPNSIVQASIADGAINAAKAPNLDVAVSTRSTYAGGDTPGTTTLLSRLTSQRAGNLDFLDAPIASRLASADYTAPANSAIAAIGVALDAVEDAVASIDGRIPAALVDGKIPARVIDFDAGVAPPTAAAIWQHGERTLTAFAFEPTVGGYAAGLDPWTVVAGGTVEGTVTLVQSARLWNAALGGKASGLDGAAANFRDLADTKNRLSAVVDPSGNRISVARDLD